MRRGLDYLCFWAGPVLVLLGVFTLAFPRISYSTSSNRISYRMEKQYRTVQVPRALSVSMALAGVTMLLNCAKIKKRGVPLW